MSWDKLQQTHFCSSSGAKGNRKRQLDGVGAKQDIYLGGSALVSCPADLFKLDGENLIPPIHSLKLELAYASRRRFR